jgi:uncharacterized protein (TIGR02453 family)
VNLQITLDFLNDLAQNNNRPWFEANRKRYDQARDAFEELVTELISELGRLDDFGALDPKACMFRIHRDVRFSKDKSPYKATMSAWIGPGGRKGTGRGYYIQLAPHDESFFGSGLHEPDKTALEHVRRHIALDAAPLRQILEAPAFVREFGELAGETLKTAPGGYDRQHPAIDLLRYKQFLAIHRLTDSDVLGDDLVSRLVRARNAMQPLLDWLDQATSAPPARWG